MAPRTVVARKMSPTTNVRRQPEQVKITGSEGNLTICPPDCNGTPRNVALKINESGYGRPVIVESALRLKSGNFRSIRRNGVEFAAFRIILDLPTLQDPPSQKTEGGTTSELDLWTEIRVDRRLLAFSPQQSHQADANERKRAGFRRSHSGDGSCVPRVGKKPAAHVGVTITE
jgi:hypothetical protein